MDIRGSVVDRRASSRIYHVDCPCEANIPHIGRVPGTIRDISEHGACLALDFAREDDMEVFASERNLWFAVHVLALGLSLAMSIRRISNQGDTLVVAGEFSAPLGRETLERFPPARDSAA